MRGNDINTYVYVTIVEFIRAPSVYGIEAVRKCSFSWHNVIFRSIGKVPEIWAKKYIPKLITECRFWCDLVEFDEVGYFE